MPRQSSFSLPVRIRKWAKLVLLWNFKQTQCGQTGQTAGGLVKTQDGKLLDCTSANLVALPLAPHPRNILGGPQLETLDSTNGFVADSNGCFFVAYKNAWNDVGTIDCDFKDAELNELIWSFSNL